MKWLERLYNRIRGYGFEWAKDGDYLIVKPGTCPYPIHFDWSAETCIKSGDCGCDKARQYSTTMRT
jgi:hypothetical protein